MMDDKRGCNHNVTALEMVVRNDCEDLCSAVQKSHNDGKFDKESLVFNNGQAAVEVKTREPNIARSVLTCLVVLLLLAVCVVVVVLLVRSTDKATSINQVCSNSNCVLSAAKLISGANLSADPCVDFYEYSCGGWKAQNFIPGSDSEWNGFTTRRKALANILKRALDSKTIVHEKGNAIEKVLNLYTSCTNTTHLDVLGAGPLKTLLEELGSWPIINDTWKDNGWNMEEAFFTHHSIFFSYIHHGRPAPIFNSYVKVDDRNSTTHIISVDEPEFLLVPRDFKTDDARWKEILPAYEQMLKEYVQLLGGNSSTTQIKDLLDFEMKLADASTPVSEFRDVMKSYRTLTLKEFVETIGNQFDWKRYLQKTFAMQNLKIEDKTRIGTKSTKYLKKVDKLLSVTSKRTIANYLGWVVVQKFSDYLSSAFRNVGFKFRKVLRGVNKEIDHWRRCLEVVEDNMDMGIARLYSKATMRKSDKEKAKEVVEGVKDTFIQRLKQLDWMDEATKRKGNEKAKQMIYDIGYPDFINSEKELDKIYQALDISNMTYLRNLVNGFKWRRKNNLDLINLPVNKRIWDIAPTQVNAYYDVSNNKMVFLAGIMGDPFFDSTAPMSLLYGSFGFVAGHEITHGFDDQGRRYNPNGNLKDWWSASSSQAFKTKASCIERQYSAYKYKDMNVKGNMTLGENIADNGGIKIAYSAYKRWVKRHGEEPKLPGIDLNHHQLFFLSFGQLWCALYNEQKGKDIVMKSVHSLPELRVTGPISNTQEFADAFNCPANSPMMRRNKCEMW